MRGVRAHDDDAGAFAQYVMQCADRAARRLHALCAARSARTRGARYADCCCRHSRLPDVFATGLSPVRHAVAPLLLRR